MQYLDTVATQRLERKKLLQYQKLYKAGHPREESDAVVGNGKRPSEIT
jgi:hypothetical protein